jgi:hypothetical protein
VRWELSWALCMHLSGSERRFLVFFFIMPDVYIVLQYRTHGNWFDAKSGVKERANGFG